VVHANALLTPRGRLALARCIVEDGWSLRRAAERFQTSHNTARRWAARYRGRDLSRPAIEAWVTGPAGRTAARGRPGRRLCDGSVTCVGPAAGDRPGSDTGSGCTPRRSIGSCAEPGWRRWRTWPGHPAPAALGGARATSTPIRSRWCTWTSRNSGKIPTGGGHQAHGRVLGGCNSRLTTTIRKNSICAALDLLSRPDPGLEPAGCTCATHTALGGHSPAASPTCQVRATRCTRPGRW
jgi:hypothetical protein